VKTILSLLLLCCCALPLLAAEASPDAAMIAKFEKELADLDATLAGGKGTVAQFSRRGDLRVFLVKFEEAVADYEKMSELDPTQGERHWRLGIAYYLAGEFEKSAKLFEKYYEVDNGDRETGLWHFLATAGLTDLPTAQLKMLHYDKDSRQPFTQLFELFGGRVSTEEFFRGLYDDGLSMKQDAMFYARLYAGIYEEVSEHPEKAAKFLRMAYESPWGRKATGGAGYMWQIARILATAKAEEPATEKPAEEKKPEAEKK
jgi:tetratricopeptide (TPR) repeat protein